MSYKEKVNEIMGYYLNDNELFNSTLIEMNIDVVSFIYHLTNIESMESQIIIDKAYELIKQKTGSRK